MADRTALTAGIAAASIAAVVAATPALITPNQETQVVTAAAAAPALKQLSVDDYRLLALADITPKALLDAFRTGHGEIVTSGPDAVTQAGLVGVQYFLIDSLLPAGVKVDNYVFELGFLGAAGQVAEDHGAGPATVEFIKDPAAAVLATIVAATQGAFGEPEASLISGLVTSFIVGYPFSGPGADGADAGPVGLVKYIIHEVLALAARPAAAKTQLVSDVQESKVEDNSKLVSLDTSKPSAEVAAPKPFKKFAAAVEDFTAAKEKAVKADVDNVKGKLKLGKLKVNFDGPIAKAAKEVSASLKAAADKKPDHKKLGDFKKKQPTAATSTG